MMNKRHYEAIAEIIKDIPMIVKDGEYFILREDLVNYLCVYLKRDNPLFDKKKFMEACGV
jgi:hypothetical protein